MERWSFSMLTGQKKKKKVYLNNEKMSLVQYLDIKCLQLLNIIFIQGRFKNPCLT